MIIFAMSDKTDSLNFDSIGCAYVDFDGEGENIDDLIQARLGCRPLWSWVFSSW